MTDTNAKAKTKNKKGKLDTKIKVLIGVGAALIVAIVVALIIMVPVLSTLKDGKIHSNVYIGPIDVSNLTEAEAEAKVQDYFKEYSNGKITFKVGEEKTEYTADQLKVAWGNTDVVKTAMDVGRTGSIFTRYRVLKDLETNPVKYDIALSYDEEAVKNTVDKLAEEFNREAVDAKLTRENGKFVITDGKTGILLDTEASKAKISEYFAGDWVTAERTIELVATVEQPKGTREELSKVKDLLGGFKTSCGSEGSRVLNIKNGTSKINGSVIYPGETFSANAPMEPYTGANGYYLGGTYENGRVVQSYGGGICQVSTTLYNAVLLSELEIVERANHSMIVTYVDPSMDAAIAGTWKDLKFKNNTNAPIYIEGYVSGGWIYFNIYGQETRSSTHEVKYVSETLSVDDPKAEYVVVNEQVGYFNRLQATHEGKTARLWKIVYENGKEVSRTIENESEYKASPALYEVGLNGATSEEAAAINSAIANQEFDRLEALCAAARAARENPAPAETPAPTDGTGTDPSAVPESTTP